jgi:hypothetical protein
MRGRGAGREQSRGCKAGGPQGAVRRQLRVRCLLSLPLGGRGGMGANRAI